MRPARGLQVERGHEIAGRRAGGGGFDLRSRQPVQEVAEEGQVIVQERARDARPLERGLERGLVPCLVVEGVGEQQGSMLGIRDVGR